MFVDSQCHVAALWYEPVESLLDQMNRCGVAQAVLIQMIGQVDNSYQQHCMQRHAGRFASVVWLDVARPDAVDTLRRLAGEGASGVRLRPAARSPGPDPLEIWRCAEELGLPVSCVGNSTAFAAPEFFELVQSLPGLPIVLEHLAGTSQPDADEAASALREKCLELAQFQNVFLKIPGLGELITRKSPLPSQGSPFDTATPEILRKAVTRFGAARLMWGSDYPPVSSREGYRNALQLCRAALGFLSDSDQALIFGGVARRLFKLPNV